MHFAAGPPFHQTPFKSRPALLPAACRFLTRLRQGSQGPSRCSQHSVLQSAQRLRHYSRPLVNTCTTTSAPPRPAPRSYTHSRSSGALRLISSPASKRRGRACDSLFLRTCSCKLSCTSTTTQPQAIYPTRPARLSPRSWPSHLPARLTLNRRAPPLPQCRTKTLTCSLTIRCLHALHHLPILRRHLDQASLARGALPTLRALLASHRAQL